MAETSNRKTYHEQTYIDNTLRLREILKTLPPFAKDYFRAVEPTTSARTRISYAYDIRVFFHFLMENNPVYKNYTIEQFEVHDLERLEPVDIEEYQEYLKVYKNDEEKCITNTEKGLARKMSALRSFYGYYFKRQIISKNPTLLVEMPKLHEKAIIRLDTDAKAKDLINKTDKKRASYYNYYTNKKWGEAASYELCLNSSELGVQGTAKAIEQYILLKESIEKEARNIV